MSQSISEFLKEKLGNMARWIADEFKKNGDEVSINLEQLVKDRSAVEVTFLAQTLNANSSKVTHRDWYGLISMLEDESLSPFVAIAQQVRAREDMHDKFWRYLELFSKTVQISKEKSE